MKLNNIYVSLSPSQPREGLSLKYRILNETIHLTTSSSLPKEYSEAYKEAIIYFENQCYRACVLMTRVILEEITERKLKENGVANISESLAGKIKQLSNQKIIFPELIPICDDIKEFGNQAAHEIKPVKPGHAETCLEFADILISLLYGENNIVYLNDKTNQQ
jgi:hypothetical protein